MKRVLKKSEVYVKLHSILQVKSLDITNFSCVEITPFYRCYFMIVHYSNVHQFIFIDLHLGLIQLFFMNSFANADSSMALKLFPKAIREHLAGINLDFE